MLNTAILMGRLTADPELRRTSADVAVTTFTLAVDRGYVKAGAERQADFINIVCWRSTAEFVSKYFRKGMLVAVEGSIQTRTYTDSQDVKRKAFEIVADRVHFAEPRRDSASQSAPTGEGRPSPKQEAAHTGDNGDFIEIESDDDLPF
ncbi:MAG: single-stranded DNA-binding protein [Clostridia bacterium]|nr:single-stranded DNA-binding protein [Clostridia bacterium]